MGDGRIFLKIRHNISFKKGLSNEPTFGLIHLAGQYLWAQFFLGQSLRKLQRRDAFIGAFPIERWKMTIDNWFRTFSSRLFQSLYKLCVQLAIVGS